MVGLAQIAPVWLQREATLAKVVDWVHKAAAEGCKLVAFGEALLPGYPFWVERTDGAKFESSLQKKLYAHYVSQAVSIEQGDLDAVCKLAAEKKIAVYLGVIERAADRGGNPPASAPRGRPRRCAPRDARGGGPLPRAARERCPRVHALRGRRDPRPVDP